MGDRAALAAAPWRTLGAFPGEDVTSLRVWAPSARSVDVVVVGSEDGLAWPLVRDEAGYYSGRIPGMGAGDRYFFRLDGERLLPDPASRFQPEGVHGPSEVVDPEAFAWSDQGWTGVARHELILYELHVGTFSHAGTFAGAVGRLPEIARLGATAIEIMPVADFAGARNWGYDGVDLFAPSRAYGRPDDFRRLVDEAHAIGLAVILDVVYNHLGPEGAYLGAFSPYYFTERHRSPWGAGVNLDGEHAEHVRRFFLENAVHWLSEYHVDGFRLDATHALQDDSPRHFLAEFAERVREVQPRAIVIAEDERKPRQMVTRAADGGWGLDAVWADDFHHHVRRMLAGDSEGYFARYSGTASDLARTVAVGWQHREAEGRVQFDAVEPPQGAYVICLQNHDQVGNRAHGERLHHQVDRATWCAATTLLLCAPETPLLFMGQEWAASTPFLYFTDHPEPLGEMVSNGRREEFGSFAAFSDPLVRDRIPDPQARTSFEASRLLWEERTREPHASVLRLYEALITLRRTEPALYAGDGHVRTDALDEDTVALRRDTASRDGSVLVVVRLRGAGVVQVDRGNDGVAVRIRHVPRFSTESPAFAPDSHPIGIAVTADALALTFARPGAVVFTG